MESLDTILSQRGAAVPETEKQEATQAPEVTTEAGQTTEQQPETEGEQGGEPGKPPIGAIRQAEREKADKRYTAVLDNLRQEIAARDAAWEQRVAKMMEAQKPPPPELDFFADPDAAVDQKIRQSLIPEIQRLEERQRNSDIKSSRFEAIQEYGAELVAEADKALSQAVQEGRINAAAIQSIPPDRLFQEATKWYQTQQRLSPDYEQKLEQKILEKHGLTNGADVQQQPQRLAPVMPSNLANTRNVGSRNGVPWGGPEPLGQIFAEKRQIFKR